MEEIIIELNSEDSYPESEFINLFKAIIIKDKEIYVAISLDFNIAMDSESIDEAKQNLNIAIKDYLESCIEDGISFYRPVHPSDYDTYEIIEKYEIKINHNILEYA